jgi:hypothetical protein
MKHKKTIVILVISIIILSAFACLAGLITRGGSGQYEYNSINGETVKIYGEGLYKNDSVSAVAQGKASDLVTLVFALPILAISALLAMRGSFRGRLLLGGTLGYFLYTYMSYTFLWMYNPLFIVYVALMSLSLFAFIYTLLSFDTGSLPGSFNPRLPVKLLGGFQLFIAFVIGMMWLGKIAPSVINGAVPVGLEHYTTLVIQGMDLGFVVPAAVLSGILLIKKKPSGYLLSSVIILKGITMLTAISAMLVNMAMQGVEMSLVEVIVFPTLNLLAIIIMIILLKNAKTVK